MPHLVQVRKCDGSCCKASPRFPNEAGDDCRYHIDNGCQLMRDASLIPEELESVKLPHLTTVDDFIVTCKQFPQFYPAHRATGDCCWQWVNNGC